MLKTLTFVKKDLNVGLEFVNIACVNMKEKDFVSNAKFIKTKNLPLGVLLDPLTLLDKLEVSK